jgi:hypothetical protein
VQAYAFQPGNVPRVKMSPRSSRGSSTLLRPPPLPLFQPAPAETIACCLAGPLAAQMSPNGGMWEEATLEHVRLAESAPHMLARLPLRLGRPRSSAPRGAGERSARQLVFALPQSACLPPLGLSPHPRTPASSFALIEAMQKAKFTARINNIYFLPRVGSSLRWAA